MSEVLEPDLTTVQVAQVLGCSRQRVTELCSSGVLPAYQLSERGPWRVRRADLDAYRQARVEAAAAAAEARRAAAARQEDIDAVTDMVRSGRLAVPARLASSSRRRRRRLYAI
ncbi:helix-turn-helix domain-containing protein [Actinomyces qiguomingii]|uniref:helix-turn-helix domain-containing protein n=1 Tax=Actinomyces qiguomingii TaxID=2057800 RepID=UPI000CA055A1|nr:helix-turn-helix domain-containing protein [Actinomyces qiguomingii]